MNNVIAYVAPKNKTMVRIMSLKNSILCFVGFSIFGFKTYCKQVSYLTEIQKNQNFKHFLQAEILNADKNNSYYQQYDAKRLRALHNQVMIKPKKR